MGPQPTTASQTRLPASGATRTAPRALTLGLSLALFGTLAVAAISGCDKPGAHAAPATARPPAPVTVAPAVARDVPVYIDQIGRAAAKESVSIVPQVGGRVMTVHFDEGSDVKKGDLLFEIDPRPFQAALNQAEAQLAQDRVNHELAKLEWNRVEDLIKTNAVSREEYDQRRTVAARTEGQVRWAEAAVDTAKLNLQYCQIRSPIDGRTGQRLVDPGNVVKANDVSMVTIQRLDPIFADFTVTERQFQEVRRNMGAGNGALSVEVSLPQSRTRVGAQPATSASSAPSPTTSTSAAPAQSRKGDLTFLDNAVTSGTGTVKLRATLPNSDFMFWPGQFVNVRLILETRHDAVLIPSTAQQIGQQGPFVYVVTQGEVADPQSGAKHPATVAEMRVIQPGQRQGNMLVVESGVRPGDQVITVGHMMVQPGAPVQVMPAQAAPGAAPTTGSDAASKSTGAAGGEHGSTTK